MLQTYKSYTRRTLAMLLAVLVAVGALFSGSFPVHAADGTISYKAGANIPYGSYFTSRAINSAFVSTVSNGKNASQQILYWSEQINAEITRKREEFGIE